MSRHSMLCLQVGDSNNDLLFYLHFMYSITDRKSLDDK